MRKILFTMLLAGTAITPAIAQQADKDDWSGPRPDRQVERSQPREDRAQAREERSEARQQVRAERAERFQAMEQGGERAEFGRDRSGNVMPADVEARRLQVQQRIRDRSADTGQVTGADIDARRMQVRQRIRENSGDVDPAQANVNERGRPVLQPNRGDRDSVADWQRRESGDVGQQRIERQVPRQRGPVPEGARPDRPAPPRVAQTTPVPQWASHWRRDGRYDWKKHRRHHRSLFHIGFYFDPFGWGYQRWGIGWRLWPSYYSNRYWLNDPWSYRLPYAPWPYRWVRYYDDALLVDTYSGQVVDVVYDFFW